MNKIPSWVIIVIILAILVVIADYGALRVHVDNIEKEFRKDISKLEAQVKKNNERIRSISDKHNEKITLLEKKITKAEIYLEITKNKHISCP